MGWELPGRAWPESECCSRSWRCYSWRLSAHCTPSGRLSLEANQSVSSPWLQQSTHHTVQTHFFIYIQEKIFYGSGEPLPLIENLLVEWTLALITEVGLLSEAGTQYLLSPLFSLNFFHPYSSSWQFFLSSSVTYTFFLTVLDPCSHILLGIDSVLCSFIIQKSGGIQVDQQGPVIIPTCLYCVTAVPLPPSDQSQLSPLRCWLPFSACPKTQGIQSAHMVAMVIAQWDLCCVLQKQ